MLMLLLGFAVGTIGTMIGVGGGFVLIPILLFVYPHANNVWISSVSMWLVSFNATSGSIAYFRQGKVHLRAGLFFILACLPGSVLGVWIAQQVNRAVFERIFAVAVILYAVTLLLRKPGHESSGLNSHSKLTFKLYAQGVAVSLLVGVIASFFGIGGGVIHVPLLSSVLGFPVHLAAGTSHFILAVTAWFTTAVHLWNGDIHWNEPILWQLAVGAVLGAQLGARLSEKVSGAILLRILAVALISVGARLLLR